MKTSWQQAGPWYNNLVGDKGQYYHEHVVLPNTLKLLALRDNSSLLDLGCGQGVLARKIPRNVFYQGVDAASFLIKKAQESDKNSNHRYAIGDITKVLPISKRDFSHAAIVLALQNIEFPEKALITASHYLDRSGILVMVLNHPCFRIPRQSSWGIDEKNKLQYRRINRYMSPMQIPIDINPGTRSRSIQTWSFHVPLQDISTYLFKAGFVIERMEEWSSDKESVGRAAKMENRSRNEIPLFMAIRARKVV
ncbi:MAG: methyltransferase domain-containing protein [Patescibacteria group bacterium]|jgi:ubiquinone/menaquinone biosynthesis C-methylase UbiE